MESEIPPLEGSIILTNDQFVAKSASPYHRTKRSYNGKNIDRDYYYWCYYYGGP